MFVLIAHNYAKIKHTLYFGELFFKFQSS